MKSGDVYQKNRKRYIIKRVNKTQNATYIMLEEEDIGRTFTVGKKVLENEYKEIK